MATADDSSPSTSSRSSSTSSRTPLDEALRNVRAGDVEGEGTRWLPSLDKLTDDQATWLREWVQEGYDSRRELILESHQMQFWTLGRVPHQWYADVCSSNVPISILVTSDRRYNYRDRPVDLDQARKERRLLAAKYVRPALRAAYREMRENAKQYTNEDERMDSLDGQSFFAMRPVLDWLYRQQADRLLRFLNGFDDMDDVDVWLDELNHAHLGELSNVGGAEDFDLKVVSGGSPVEDVLMRTERKYERERELWAATYLLPAFNRAVTKALRIADEHKEDEVGGGLETKGI
jgi:hypothetical protein